MIQKTQFSIQAIFCMGLEYTHLSTLLTLYEDEVVNEMCTKYENISSKVLCLTLNTIFIYFMQQW